MDTTGGARRARAGEHADADVRGCDGGGAGTEEEDELGSGDGGRRDARTGRGGSMQRAVRGPGEATGRGAGTWNEGSRGGGEQARSKTDDTKT